ncbi:MAG: NAD(P)/FAD-dependent oxidoreductase [Candidatus Kapabacteria bacterium]|nr:NAD(P)/FAD-dependent oxidoreductase [Ignavibacteriota bacterium]MCW5885908.1 NAD(P)/FAD-dependent oxidoreductase [Candidatus Kapabacteria bacterium]
MKVAVIGGGAAGFFAAINTKENFPDSELIIFEKSYKVLAKLRISGGGRCNVTNNCKTIDELCAGYPRGGRKLKGNFFTFSNQDTIKWFKNRGVATYPQDDNRVFPVSNDSETIINCLMNECTRLGIKIKTGYRVNSVNVLNDSRLEVIFNDNGQSFIFDKVIVATGGASKDSSLDWLEKLNHKIEKPIPSLFTFKIPNDNIVKLMGLSVENTKVSIQSTNLQQSGSLLITHWGFSGPAVLKLSAFGARIIQEMNYQIKINVNWINENSYDYAKDQFLELLADNINKQIINLRPFSIPSRLWHYLVAKNDISQSKTCRELSKKELNRIVNVLTNDEYTVRGRTTFREEFVTCGGVSLESVNLKTMQSKKVKNLYFAGEVLDIDGITGGYNFQNAWTSGFIAAKLAD